MKGPNALVVFARKVPRFALVATLGLGAAACEAEPMPPPLSERAESPSCSVNVVDVVGRTATLQVQMDGAHKPPDYSPSSVDVFFGDGLADRFSVDGANDIKHTYPNAGEYLANAFVVMGVAEGVERPWGTGSLVCRGANVVIESE